MPSMKLIMEGDGCWPDLQPKGPVEVVETQEISVAALAGGMRSGKPSVAFRIDLRDGRAVVAQTSLALFVAAARAFVAKYGEP